MLVHKGGQINNLQFITGLRIAEMPQLQNCSVMCTKNGSYVKMKKERKSQGEGGCVQRMEVIVKRKKKVGGRGGGGQGRCEQRSEAFVKIRKKKKIFSFFFFFFFFFFGWGGSGWAGGVGGGGGVRVDVN